MSGPQASVADVLLVQALPEDTKAALRRLANSGVLYSTLAVAPNGDLFEEIERAKEAIASLETIAKAAA